MKEKIFDFIKKKYSIEPQYLWLKFPEYAVFKHRENNKWFCILMNIERKKLGLEGEGIVNILNVKANPNDIPFLLNEKGILPAYHMNKNHWITILLNSCTDLDKINFLIDNSFNMTH